MIALLLAVAAAEPAEPAGCVSNAIAVCDDNPVAPPLLSPSADEPE